MMKLFILLLCLGFERYLHTGSLFRRDLWIQWVISCTGKLFKTPEGLSGWQGLLILILPAALLVGLVNEVSIRWGYDMASLLVSVVSLLFCLGPRDLYHQLQIYLGAQSKEEPLPHAAYTVLVREAYPGDEKIATRKMTEALILEAEWSFFGVIFWFMLLGPMGAIFYRMAVYLNQSSAGESPSAYALQASKLQHILDWVPARLLALFYAVVGDFQRGSSRWHTVWGASNNEVLLSVAKEALGLPEEIIEDENKKILQMVERALMMGVATFAVLGVVIFLF